jgi:uncharacterized membrane protein (UPF0136 family)
MAWISGLVTKYFGRTFITRAVTSIVALVVGYLSGLGLEVAPETLNQFGESLGQILQAVASLLLVLFVDGKFAKKDEKPEQPQIIKE